MIHSVPQEVYQRGFDLLQNGAVYLVFATLDDQIHIFFDGSGRIANHPWEGLKYGRDWQHPNPPDTVLKVGHDLSHTPAVGVEVPNQTCELEQGIAQMVGIGVEESREILDRPGVHTKRA